MRSSARHLVFGDNWRRDALCAKPEYRNLMWFPDEDWPRTRMMLEFQRTRSVCKGCPVQAECREYAERAHVTNGIWAGKDYSHKRDTYQQKKDS